MLFLLNDTVLRLDRADLRAPHRALACSALSLDFVLRLGREMFAGAPLLHRVCPDRAKKLATLIRARRPEINAALFCAPVAGCLPDLVETRTDRVPIGTLRKLMEGDGAGLLSADRAVWRRLAA